MLVEEGVGKGEQSVGFRSPVASVLFLFCHAYIFYSNGSTVYFMSCKTEH